MKSRVMVILVSVMLTVSISNAQPGEHTSTSGGQVIRLIRNEKLDLILPGAMRDNHVDMWIHVTRAGDPDPMAPEFGSTVGYLIFTDLGNRIERAVFGDPGAVEKIDVRGSEEIARAIEGYDYRTQDFSVYNEMTKFVAERDPKTIAVNTSDWLAIADGISHSQYVKLEKILGPKYSKRIVSAENVITSYRTRRILREVSALTEVLQVQYELMGRGLSREVITPGVTTIADVGNWIKEEFFKRHLTGYSIRAEGPRVLYSAKSKPISPPDVRYWIDDSSYVLQPGDFFTWDVGCRYLDYFETDFKRNGYICREGETDIPDEIGHAFDRAMEANEIIRKNIKVGRTAGETLKVLVSALENAGYIYTPFTDRGTEDYKLIQKALANTDKSGFSIDCHTLGDGGGSLVTVGPSIAPFRQDRAHLMIEENHFFSFEFMVQTNLPTLRPGFPISLNIEHDAVVSSRGVEYPFPPQTKNIILIH